nr:DUF1493 family protein [Duganella qianjiadongensis]
MFLNLSGLRDKTISTCTPQNRLYHDLRIYGEGAEDCLEVLVTKFGVDLSGFPFSEYFPPEWPEGNSRPERILLKVFPGIEGLYRKPATFEPLPLSRIEALIHSKKWHN